MTTAEWLNALADLLGTGWDGDHVDDVWHADLHLTRDDRSVTIECVGDDVTVTALSGPLTIRLAMGKRRVPPARLASDVRWWLDSGDAEWLCWLRTMLTEVTP